MTYSELQATVADWLWRTDLTAQIPSFIRNAEAAFRRDPRIRTLVQDSAFPITQQSENLPEDFKTLESLSLNAAPYQREIEIVSPAVLAEINRETGNSAGVPSHAAIVNRTRMLFAPSPNGVILARLSYWANPSTLSDTNTTNWLLDEHPDIYLYGTLIESAPFIRDDERTGLWRAEYERRIEEMDQAVHRAQFSGSLVRRLGSPIP